MAFAILGNPSPQFVDSSGSPYASGTLAVLDPADDTNKASYPTYDDAEAATNANANPITLDARGSCNLWGLDNEDYKLVLLDSAGATVNTDDDIFLSIEGITKYKPTAQTLTDAGAVTLTQSTTFLVTTGAAAITLADGSENQHKLIVMKTDAGVATLTPTNLSNGTTILFDDVGDSAYLYFIDGSWNFQGGTATVTGYTASTTVTFTSTDATPTVAIGQEFITAGTTAITDFDNGVVGQTIKILAASSITITDGAIIALKGSTDFDMVAGDTLTLHMFNDQVWEEIARSTIATGKSLTAILMTAGTGITTGSGTLYKSSVARSGAVITTQLLLDLTGLRSTAADDIIGVDGTTLDCHFGQVTAATNCTILTATITCLEVPTGGDPDINVYANVESTGSESDDPSGLTGTGILVNTGDHTLGLTSVFAAMPAANEYLYLVAGAATDADYTAGKFLIELKGY